LYYLGKEILHLTEYEFRRQTPKMLVLKARLYGKFTGEKSGETVGFIDEV
jgi:hypothetical protein